MPPLGKAHPVGAHRCAVAAANSRFHAGREKDCERERIDRGCIIFFGASILRERETVGLPAVPFLCAVK
jgi:hypothetical protein